MIIFHEGLPRSGKSYEAVVKQILEALKKGRQVFAYIEGLNHQKFSEITGISVDEMTGRCELELITPEQYGQYSEDLKQRVVKRADGWFLQKFVGLLHQIELDQVAMIYKYVANDSLVVIDEAQDHWPSSTKALSKDMTTFVTQHGHRGLDIILMGQDHRDTHMLWKRRIDQLFTFVKQDAVGRPNKYTWTSFKLNKDKFVKLNSGQGEYEAKYFGLYKSHTDGTLNKDTKIDDRTNVFKSPIFRYGLPGAALVALVAVYYLVSFFSPPAEEVAKAPKQPEVPVQVLKKTITKVKQDEPPRPELTYSQANFIEEVISTARPRLAAIVEGRDLHGGVVVTALIQFIDTGQHVKEEFTLDQLQAFGWGYERTRYGIRLWKGKKDIAVTSWPIDTFGRIPNQTREQLKSEPNRQLNQGQVFMSDSFSG